MDALKPVGNKWYQIGLRLQLTADLLHPVESDLRGSEEYDKYLEQMLKIKLENGGVPSWKEVAVSLCGLGETQLAERITKDHSESPHTHIHIHILVVFT